MAEGNDLGPRCRAGRMQDKRLVTGRGRGRGRFDRRGGAGASKIKYPGGPLALREGDHRNAARARDGRGRPWVIGIDDNGGGTQIGKIEVELVGAIGRVEGRRAGGTGDTEESRRHGGSVGQNDGDTIVVADPESRQRLRGGVDLTAQSAVGQRIAARRGQGKIRVGCGGNDLGNGQRVVHETPVGGAPSYHENRGERTGKAD